MEVCLYSIYDRVAEEFGPIFEAVNDGVALRNFRRQLQDAAYKDDYWLYYVGQWNHKDGTIILVDEKKRIEGPAEERK